jgi:UDP-N-acetylmuramate dehydrogenase
MKVFDNFDLTEFNGYKIKSICKRAYFPQNENDIIEIVNSNPKIHIIGSGHNLILSKEYYDIPFLIFNKTYNTFKLIEGLIESDSGAYLPDLSFFAYENSLSGLEFCYDIPSSIGGAVVMNAGTKEGTIQDVLHKVRYFDIQQKKIIDLEKSSLNLGYRSSVFQNNLNTIILKSWFKLNHDDKNTIWNKMNESKERRWNAQPRDYPSCGSVFKRPKGKFIGPMLEELNLKGHSIGDASISEKHAGFIINRGNATGKQIVDLIDFVKSKVMDHFGILLELEQRII